MASKLPAVKNSAFVFRCVLFAQSDNQIKANPTIASGDWKVSIDGGAFANLATLPDVDPDSSVQVKVSLSADEMNGDEIMVTAIDAAGDEWHSAAWVIHTAAQTFDTMDTNIDGILADTNELQGDWANGGRLDVILDARASQTSVDDLPTNSELATALTAADDATLAAIAALNNLSAAQVNAEVVDVLRTDTIPDSYATDGAQPTIAQALLMVWQFLSERAVSGTTVTVKKPDGSTSAMTFTLSDATDPASITRAS